MWVGSRGRGGYKREGSQGVGGSGGAAMQEGGGTVKVWRGGVPVWLYGTRTTAPPPSVQELPSPIRFNPESAHSSPTAMVAAGESRKPAYGLAGGGVDSLISVILFVLGRSSLACMWVISEAQFCAPTFVLPLLCRHFYVPTLAPPDCLGHPTHLTLRRLPVCLSSPPPHTHPPTSSI